MSKRKLTEIANNVVEKKCIDGLLQLKRENATTQEYLPELTNSTNDVTADICLSNFYNSISSSVNENIPPVIGISRSNNINLDCQTLPVKSVIKMESNSSPEQIVKEQSMRLSLLCHASQCPHQKNTCPVTPFCWAIKELWSHITVCKDQECNVKHCLSSRYILSHFSKCTNVGCAVCDLVRSQIKRNHERTFVKKRHRKSK
jgi:hypothetical protein